MLVLASGSATRKTLLANAGIRFLAQPAALDERSLERAALDSGADSAGVALALARAKAQAVAADHPGAVVLGSDQTLSCAGVLLHKPLDRAQARAQLLGLRGRSHTLHAAIAFVRDGAVLSESVDSASLTMRAFSDSEFDAVLAAEGDQVLASVGAYRLEGPSVRLFEAIAGDYFTILGLPLFAVLAALRAHAPQLLEPIS